MAECAREIETASEYGDTKTTWKFPLKFFRESIVEERRVVSKAETTIMERIGFEAITTPYYRELGLNELLAWTASFRAMATHLIGSYNLNLLGV